jgi:hypothetical protein
MSNQYEDEENDPEVIAAKAAAEEKTLLAQAEVIKARSTMHPAAQIWYITVNGINSFFSGIGCFFLLLVIVLVIFEPSIITWFTNLVH